MKKNNWIYVGLGVVVVIVCVVLAIVLNNSRNMGIVDGDNHQGTVQKIDSEERIMRKYNEPTSEDIDKTINISRSESGEFDVTLKTESGHINVQVFAERGKHVYMLTENEDVTNEKVAIEQGEGNYIIRISAEDFKGQFDISWKVANNEAIEKYTSDAGYETEYNKNIFDVEKIQNGERFTLKELEEASADSKEYIDVLIIPKERAQAVKSEKIKEDDRVGDCYIGVNLMSGKYVSRENENNSDTTERSFIIDLEDGRLLLVEEHFELHSENETELNKILDKIVIK